MKLAIISDIHANIVALEAVYEHIHAHKPDAVYCLGDLVNQNVWNNEVVDFMRANNIPSVLGNHDEGIGNNKADFSFAYGSREEKEYGHEAIAFTLNQTSEENKAYLRALPKELALNVQCCDKKLRILMVHGMPGDNTKRLYHFLPQEEIANVITTTDADILLVGNTHWEYHKIVETITGESTSYRHVINPGSVGCPKDGNWEPCYVLIDIDELKFAHGEMEAIKTSFYRVDYDLDKVIKSIQHSKLPLHYAARLLQ